MSYEVKFDLDIMDRRNRARTIKHYSIKIGKRDRPYTEAADRLLSVTQELVESGYSVLNVADFRLEEV